MQLSRIFLICFALGIAGGYIVMRRPEIAVAPPAPAPSSHREGAPENEAPLVPNSEHDEASLAEVENRAPIEALSVTRPPPLPAPPSAAAPPSNPARAKAEELAAAETLDPENARVMLEQVLTGKLPNELTPRQYDAIAQAFLRARAAERVLNGLDATPENESVREEYRVLLDDTISEVEDITGLKVAEVRQLVDPPTRVAEQKHEEGAAEEPQH